MSTGLAPDRHRLSTEEIERARRRFDIMAAEIPMKRVGRELCGLCVFHNERSPSFYVVPDKGFWICFGCGATGNAVDYVVRTRGLSFVDAVHEINGTTLCRPRNAARPVSAGENRELRRDSADYVEAIVRGCGTVCPGTAAYLYLQTRGLISKVNRAPVEAALSALRAHPSLDCTEAGRPIPALVAPITSSDGVTALQRIWVAERIEYINGVGPKDARAELRVRKKSLGQMLDGAVRMGAPRDRLGLAEGVETAIAAALLNRGMPVWATCGASRLASVAIPESVTTIRIYGDNGETGFELAHRAAQVYHRQGYKVDIRFPAPRFDDFNTELLAQECVR